MKDFQEDENIEQTLTSIWKEFAWYLKEVARKHDDLIEMNKDRCSHIENKLDILKRDFENYLANEEKRSKQGWTIIEKIGAAIAFLIMAGLALWANLR